MDVDDAEPGQGDEPPPVALGALQGADVGQHLQVHGGRGELGAVLVDDDLEDEDARVAGPGRPHRRPQVRQDPHALVVAPVVQHRVQRVGARPHLLRREEVVHLRLERRRRHLDGRDHGRLVLQHDAARVRRVPRREAEQVVSAAAADVDEEHVAVVGIKSLKEAFRYLDRRVSEIAHYTKSRAAAS